MAGRYLPLLIGDAAPPLRSPSAATLRRRNAAKKRRPAKKAKRKAAKRKAKKRPAAKRRATARRTPLRGGKRGKRGGTVKPTGKYEHLRARSPSSFVKSSFKTIPWAFTSAADQKMVKKILGLRTIPKGTKVITGRFKPGAKKDRVPGVRVKYLANGIQSVLVPIKGGKAPKSPPGTKRKAKRTVRKIAKRARKNPLRLNHHTTKPGRGKYAKVCMKIYGPIHEGKRKNRWHSAETRRRQLKAAVSMYGVDRIHSEMLKMRDEAKRHGLTREAKAIQSDIAWMAKTYGTGKGARRSNPGRLAILANPLPKAIEECAKAMRGEKRRRFLAYYASLKPGDQQRMVKGLQLYKKRHGVPCSDFELKKVKGTRVKVEVGVGRAEAIEYHANKGYTGSSKKGTPYRHEFENGQHVVSDENGRKLEVVDRKGAKRKTVTTDWIYN